MIDIAVLMGGPDAERDVSIASGTAIADALETLGEYRVARHIIDRPRIEDLTALAADVVFPALHGPFGEGGVLQEMLEGSGVCFVGSNAKASALAMDKIATKQRASSLGMRTPAWSSVGADQSCGIEPPLMLKPVADGSSVDMRICRTAAEVSTGILDLSHRSSMMAESLVSGREVTVSVLEDEALPVLEIVPATGFYDYSAKYDRDDTRYVTDPDIDCRDLCQDQAMQLCRSIGVRDLARVDYIVDDGGPWLLEVNTMPGFTTHSLFPMAAKAHGLDMPSLCSRLVLAAARRHTPTHH
jgi:D-alanine-D-alanine ligase